MDEFDAWSAKMREQSQQYSRIRELERKVHQLEVEMGKHKHPPVQQEAHREARQEARRAWSSFEQGVLNGDLDYIVHKRSAQFGRSPNSIIWELYRQICARRK